MMDLAVYLAVGLAPTGQHTCAGTIRAIEALMPDDLSNPGDFDRFVLRRTAEFLAVVNADIAVI